MRRRTWDRRRNTRAARTKRKKMRASPGWQYSPSATRQAPTAQSTQDWTRSNQRLACQSTPVSYRPRRRADETRRQAPEACGSTQDPRRRMRRAGAPNNHAGRRTCIFGSSPNGGTRRGGGTTGRPPRLCGVSASRYAAHRWSCAGTEGVAGGRKRCCPFLRGRFATVCGLRSAACGEKGVGRAYLRLAAS